MGHLRKRVEGTQRGKEKTGREKEYLARHWRGERRTENERGRKSVR